MRSRFDGSTNFQGSSEILRRRSATASPTEVRDAPYVVNRIRRRGWREGWRNNGRINHRRGTVANRDLWERLLEAARRQRGVRWKKVMGHSKSAGARKAGNDGEAELAVAAKGEEAIADLSGARNGRPSGG